MEDDLTIPVWLEPFVDAEWEKAFPGSVSAPIPEPSSPVKSLLKETQDGGGLPVPDILGEVPKLDETLKRLRERRDGR